MASTDQRYSVMCFQKTLPKPPLRNVSHGWNKSYEPCPQLRVVREVKQNGLEWGSKRAYKLWFQILDTEGGNTAPLKLNRISDPVYLQFLELKSHLVPPPNSKNTFPLIRVCNVVNIYLCDQQFLLFVLWCYRILGFAPELGQGEQPHCPSTNMLSLHHIPPRSPPFQLRSHRSCCQSTWKGWQRGWGQRLKTPFTISPVCTSRIMQGKRLIFKVHFVTASLFTAFIRTVTWTPVPWWRALDPL